MGGLVGGWSGWTGRWVSGWEGARTGGRVTEGWEGDRRVGG